MKMLVGVICAALVGITGCSKQAAPIDVAEARNQSEVFILSAGSSVPVRLLETLDSRTSRAGDHFTASLDEPLTAGDRVMVPKGTVFTGHVTGAGNSGHLKGHASISLTLDSFQLDDKTYQVNSTSAGQVSRGHKRRNWLLIGSGAGGGAAIGAAAGGGGGALIGAGAGAAAGTVGAIFTGRQHVQLPVETRVSFKLASPIEIER